MKISTNTIKNSKRNGIGFLHFGKHPTHSALSHRCYISRQGGGIEPLYVSMPQELKSCPSTSPTHLGHLCMKWKVEMCPKQIQVGN